MAVRTSSVLGSSDSRILQDVLENKDHKDVSNIAKRESQKRSSPESLEKIQKKNHF